jgi:hypothetical protein
MIPFVYCDSKSFPRASRVARPGPSGDKRSSGQAPQREACEVLRSLLRPWAATGVSLRAVMIRSAQGHHHAWRAHLLRFYLTHCYAHWYDVPHEHAGRSPTPLLCGAPARAGQGAQGGAPREVSTSWRGARRGGYARGRSGSRPVGLSGPPRGRRTPIPGPRAPEEAGHG